MKEEEAKTKWCPMVRLESSVAPGLAVIGTNRNEASDGQNEINVNCIGSECMAWRREFLSDEGTGYCGLMK